MGVVHKVRGGLLAAAATLLAVSAGFAAETGVSSTQIVIGQTISSGEGASAYARAISQGIDLYFAKVNASGGIGGRKIVLKVLDDQADSSKAAANARDLVRQGVFLLFAPLEGGPAVAVAEVAEESGKVLFAPLAGSPSLTQPVRPLVFSVRAPHRIEFDKLLAYASTLSVKRVAFFRAATATGEKHLANLSASAKRLNVDMVADLPYRDGATDDDLAKLLEKAHAAQARAIINHGSPRMYERLILRSKVMGLNFQFLGVNSGSSEIAKRLGRDARGLIFAQITPDPDSGRFALTREFAEAWRARHKSAATSHGALEGYMSAKALAIALERVASNPTTQGLIDALHAKPIDLGGLRIEYRPESHDGLAFTDLSFVRDDGTFAY